MQLRGNLVADLGRRSKADVRGASGGADEEAAGYSPPDHLRSVAALTPKRELRPEIPHPTHTSQRRGTQMPRNGKAGDDEEDMMSNPLATGYDEPANGEGPVAFESKGGGPSNGKGKAKKNSKFKDGAKEIVASEGLEQTATDREEGLAAAEHEELLAKREAVQSMEEKIRDLESDVAKKFDHLNRIEQMEQLGEHEKFAKYEEIIAQVTARPVEERGAGQEDNGEREETRAARAPSGRGQKTEGKPPSACLSLLIIMRRVCR